MVANIHHVKDKVGETEVDTRSSCVTLARQHMDVTNATEADYTLATAWTREKMPASLFDLKILICGQREYRAWIPYWQNQDQSRNAPVLRCLKLKLLQ